MQAEIILFIIIFLYGIVLGSFLNVLIYRIPLKENIATDRSHCMSCGAQIKWYDLIPIVSFLVLKGRCRNCGNKISIQYPLIEGVNGFGYVLIFAVKGFSWPVILDCILFSIFIVISMIDFRTYEIPASLNFTVMILAIVITLLDYNNLMQHLIGMFVVSGFMLILLLIGRAWKDVDAFGGGDIKLMAACGLYFGWKDIILAFLLACILGAVIHSIRIKATKVEHLLAFGPYLCTGLFVVMMAGNQMIQWYMNLITG